MPSEPPELIAIDHDDYYAEHVGRTADGRQFFQTTPFEPALFGGEGCEYLALFMFDKDGNFVDAQIDSFGPRDLMDEEKARSCLARRLSELGEVSRERIEVKPFSIERFGVTFGLLPVAPEDDDDDWWVELHPGNYLAFYAPWDSGEYDT